VGAGQKSFLQEVYLKTFWNTVKKLSRGEQEISCDEMHNERRP
jgi:hypothetical protein